MGYSYDMQNRLCCDFCGNAGKVRKMKCPFNWCQPLATCPTCKVTKADVLSKNGHIKHGCEKDAARWTLQTYEYQELLEAGRYLRKAAMGHGDRVKVFFEHKENPRCYWMADATYKAIGYGNNATLEDYQAIGDVKLAINVDLHDAEVPNG